ncbi:uncharacterized protein LOC113239270, partial [Hyposmocoma kahamanoa]|uniref:uncharacterized protein LOC113239270 n=1 Tax=Hyposmocoma kahamanoa TaxID=1477025 RepID=UPI000E6D7B1F
MLLKIATKGIDADNIVRNASFIHSLDFIYLLTTMSQLQYPSLKQLLKDVFGTSYELETARNLFLEVLPYVRNEAAARLIRHMVIDQKAKIEDATLVTLLRKLPFNLVDYNRPLLEELEVFTKLGVDFPQEIRHAGILSFATMVGKAMDASFDQQYFDDIYDKYLRMYNYFPQYLDRLVWLQGLTNIGQSVAHYLTEIHTDTHKEPHERLWTALAALGIWKETSLSNALPIITNSTEHIQLRIIALHAFLSSSHTSRDFLNIHDYVKNCNNNQLKKFWYSTVKSLEKNRFYYRYKIASHYIPFVTNQLRNPGLQFWATNNYIISQEPTLDVQGPAFQLLTVGGGSGLPELIMVEFSTGGERPFNAALYIIVEGIPAYAFRRLQSFNGTAAISEELQNLLKNFKVTLVEPTK